MAGLHLPDLVTHKIIQILPTKAAVRMSFLAKQWAGVWCSSSVLDFDEGGYEESLDCRDNLGDQHRKFINNILKRYLEFCGHDKQKKQRLDKLRLHMTGYLLTEDTTIVDELLSCSFERNVKELDINLRLCRLFQRNWHEKKNYYCLSRTTFLDAKSITTLCLSNVRIEDIRNANDGPIDHISQLLPSLKRMCLKAVHFDKHALRYLICECPCIEYLSLTSCSFDDDREDALSMFYLSSYTLEFLEVKYCKAPDIRVDDTINLESFTFVSSKFLPVESIMLHNSHNLKHINVHARYLKKLYVSESHRSLEATINAPNLNSVLFVGYLTSKISLKAPNLSKATILLWDFWDVHFPTAFNGAWKHLPVLAGFLKEFGRSKNLDLFVADFKNVVFPTEFRSTSSCAILPGLDNNLALKVSNYLETDSDISELEDSLTWIAPSARDISVNKIIGTIIFEY